MSRLYLATDPVPLAAELARAIEDQVRRGEPFATTTVVIPNRYLGKWLRLWVARQHGVAINLRFVFLESALWEMLRTLDPRFGPPRLQQLETSRPECEGYPAIEGPELLDATAYRLLVLSVL